MTYEQLLELEEKVGNVKKGIYQDCDKCIISQEEFIYGHTIFIKSKFFSII